MTANDGSVHAVASCSSGGKHSSHLSTEVLRGAMRVGCTARWRWAAEKGLLHCRVARAPAGVG